jgi:hypothetical protein
MSEQPKIFTSRANQLLQVRYVQIRSKLLYISGEELYRILQHLVFVMYGLFRAEGKPAVHVRQFNYKVIQN